MQKSSTLNFLVLFSLFSLFNPITATANEEIMKNLGENKHGKKLYELLNDKTTAIDTGWMILVDKSDKELYLCRDGEVNNEYIVAIGRKDYPTKTGTFELLSKTKDPDWTPSRGIYSCIEKEVREYLEAHDGIIPSGHPLNPLGKYYFEYTKSRGIHGTNDPSSLGKESTLGCIRAPLPCLETIDDSVPLRTKIIIQD